MDISHTVLETGTGSGYQTALLAEFSGKVYTIERISELSLSAQKTLARLGMKNIRFTIDDGSIGWPEYAPYDRIMVTAAAAELPMPLVECSSLSENPDCRYLLWLQKIMMALLI